MLQTSTSAIAPNGVTDLDGPERSHEDLQHSHDNQNELLSILNSNEHQNTQQFLAQGGNRTPRSQLVTEPPERTETVEESK